MVLDNQENLNYIFNKAVDALIFSTDYDYMFKKLQEIFIIDREGLLNCICNKLNYIHDILDDTMKDNLYKIVQYFRYEYKCDGKEKEAVRILCNSIINNVNSSTREKTYDFVSEQIKRRGFANSARHYATRPNMIMEAFQDVKDFIVMDFNILCLHTELCSNEEYENSIPDLIDIELPCMYSLNLIFDEYPVLLRSPLFRERIYNTSRLLEENILNNGKKSSIPFNILTKEHSKYQKKLRAIS